MGELYLGSLCYVYGFLLFYFYLIFILFDLIPNFINFYILFLI